MNKKLLLIIAVSTAFAVGETLAQNRQQGRGFGPPGGERGQRGGPPGGGRFGGGQRPSMMSHLPVLKALDADGNGEISSKEMANAAAALKSLDRNGDGKLTEDEVRPQGPPGGGRGGFGRGQGQGQGGDNFGPPRGDSGRGDSGRGDRGNMERGRGFGGPPRGGDSQGGQERGPGRPDPEEMVKRLMAFDKNGDGKLAKDELSERMQSLITRADKNRDGYADKAELMNLAGGRGGQNRGGQREAPPQGSRPRRPEFDN